MQFKTYFKRNISLFQQIVGPCIVINVMSKAGSINPLLSSRVVSWSFCSKLLSPVEGPDSTCSCVFFRDNLRLPLTIIIIIHCVLSANASTHHLLGTGAKELNSTVSTQCQLVSTQYQFGCLFPLTEVI